MASFPFGMISFSSGNHRLLVLSLIFCFHSRHTPLTQKIFAHLGASLDRRNGKLVEAKAKALYDPMPVIYIYAVQSSAGKDPKMYECPIYRKPNRNSATYIGSIDLETDVNPRHWTLRGVALLCDIK